MWMTTTVRPWRTKAPYRMSAFRVDMIADIYAGNIMDMGHVVRRLKSYCDQVKNIEMSFFKDHDVNVVLEEDAIDAIIRAVHQENR